ncbi:outer membrane protein [Alteromonadaceae bacterium 2753L.S.0a.02]|nr:outer membrane protein [Alteromonadaceae bacterium 2753L.S.0a.02]
MQNVLNNNYLRAACLTAVLLPGVASADTVLGVYGGIGVWTTSIDGSIGVDDIPITTEELGIKDENANFFYIALEHPIPVIPNIRIARATVKNTGSALVEREFTWDNITFPANAQTDTTIDLTQTDVTLYYEILDNWVSFDVGLNAKVIDGFASVLSQPEGQEAIYEEFELKGAVPMLYGMARFDLPLSGLFIGARANYVGYDNSMLSDFDVQIGYLFESVLDVGAELGYRQFKLKLDEFDDANLDITYDGPYLNLAVHF